MASNAVPPSVVPPSPDEWPQDLVKTITAISKARQAQITIASHGFTTSSEGTTFLCIKQVLGMIQINGLNCLLQQVVDSNNFTVNINSTYFYTYQSGGVVIVDTGLPPTTTTGFQTYNTPFQNVANTL